MRASIKNNPQFDIEQRDGDGLTPLHEAVAMCSRNADVVKVLLDAGTNIEARTENEQTPLHMAETSDVVKVLLDAGANAKVHTLGGLTPWDLRTNNPNLTRNDHAYWLLAGATNTGEIVVWFEGESFGCSPLGGAARWSKSPGVVKESLENSKALSQKTPTPLLQQGF